MINTTTQYPLDVYGATFYYEVMENNHIKVYHTSWEGIQGIGKTIQEAIKNMLINAKNPNKYEVIDDSLRGWLTKIRNIPNE